MPIISDLDNLSSVVGELESHTPVHEIPDHHVSREKRRYNKAWFGKTISAKERGRRNFGSLGSKAGGPYHLSKFLQQVNSKKMVDWLQKGQISPKSISKKWGPMLSWKPRRIKGSKRWFVAHKKRLSPFGLSHSNKNVNPFDMKMHYRPYASRMRPIGFAR